jgi:hypothetical protein
MDALQLVAGERYVLAAIDQANQVPHPSGSMFRLNLGNAPVGAAGAERTNGSMPHTPRPRFGIMTAPSQVDYHDVLRVWREADTIPEIEHAWLFDHLMPIGGDPSGPTYEGWTLLSALAAQTQRLRLGVLVTSNRFRPPAMLAKIAATVDIVSGGRLDFGIGAGSRPSHPLARREYEAHGLPFHDSAHAVGSLAEACTVVRRLWTEAEPFDFHGAYGDMDDAVRRSALLDRYCAEIGRDPASVTRSIHLPVSYDQPSITQDTIGKATDAGFQHIVLGLPAPYPANVAQWATDELITTSA